MRNYVQPGDSLALAVPYAGGVTSGIDFAFRVAEHRFGRDIAEAIQLSIEYDPAPLAGGTPRTARPEILARVRGMMADRLAAREAEIAEIADRYRPPQG